ncbi:F-box/FBD/LRR-repeat protein At1g13570-like isoform X4 [Diospyros lotus]|uniref:F-box/FBD/LRR-repeat protein At1g13570-like isoform X4 n=1 Tax=Diospyros lotus TaxID=55363 RepID=UPI002250968D|nr:F-box/FBD/LRR-repeat protein At1g13570-like isoform X4 [Diospyros lotus]
MELISAGGVPKRLPINLNHLKILKLHLEKVKEVSSILCLVRSSPNLEKFVIWGPINGIADEETAVKLLEVHGWSDICLNQLQEVELREACGSRFELAFIELLLAISPILEKMIIVSNDMDNEGLRLLDEVLEDHDFLKD